MSIETIAREKDAVSRQKAACEMGGVALANCEACPAAPDCAIMRLLGRASVAPAVSLASEYSSGGSDAGEWVQNDLRPPRQETRPITIKPTVPPPARPPVVKKPLAPPRPVVTQGEKFRSTSPRKSYLEQLLDNVTNFVLSESLRQKM